MSEPVQGEIMEDEGTEVAAGAMLATLNRAEINVQVATAHRYPRSVTRFREEALAQATLDDETAGSMFYALKRGGKVIEGPSVRLAEICGSSWGNIRYAARIVDIDAKFVTAQGMAFDLEKNLAAAIEVKRRITDSKGARYGDDMIGVTCNAAMSIALRNAIFKVIPFAFVKGIYEAAKQASLGKALTMEARRQGALDWFGKNGASQADLLKYLDRAGLDDVTIDDLLTLRGLSTAIMDGETTWASAFREAMASEDRKPTTVTPASLTMVGAQKARGAAADDSSHAESAESVEARSVAPPLASGPPAEQPKPKQGSLVDF